MSRVAKWVQYHPEAGLVRVNVAEKVGRGESAQIIGRDIDIKLADASDDLLSALDALMDVVAYEVEADADTRAEPTEVIERVTTVEDTGPESRARGSVVKVSRARKTK